MDPDRAGPRAAALLLVLLAAAAFRLASAFTLGDGVRLHGDEHYYVRTATALAAGEGHPGSLRPPGYPAFVAAAFSLGAGLRGARVAQIGVSLIGIAALFALVHRRFGTAAAVLSTLWCALHPTLVFYSHLFWSETMVATLLLVVVLCLDRFELERRDAWLAGAGAALGGAVLTRDMLLFFVPVVAAWTWLVPGSGGRDAVKRAALVTVPVLLAIVPWMARNQAQIGQPVLSTNSWFPLAVGNLIPRHGLLGMADESRQFSAAYDKLPSELERAAFARTTAIQAIADRQPGWIGRKLVRNTYYLLSTASQLTRFVKERWLPPAWQDFGRRLTSVEAAFHVLQTAVGLVALWLVPGGRVKLLVVALLVFHWAVYVVANATNRFRVPLLPFLALYAGPLLAGYGRQLRGAGWRLAGAVASLGVFAAVVLTPLVRRLLAVVCVASLVATGCRAAGEVPRPNVVLISLDTLRADHLGTYGYARRTSPNVDAFAAAGVLFERATSPSSWTLPAHASMLSGLSPWRHGAISEATRIGDGVPMLAELLRAQGYHTIALVNAPFVGRDYGFARGFDRFEQRFQQRQRDVAARHAEILAVLPELTPPFFLFLHYMDVHTPYRPPERFNRFAKDRRSSQVLRDLGEHGVLELQRAARAGRLRMSPADRDRLVDLYDGEILALDAHLGDLLGVLRARFPDTIVIVTADHGEEFLEHGRFGHGDTLYEEVLRVPLIVSGPGVARGARLETLASLVDLVPTILDRAGAPLPAGLDGRSLLPLLRAGRDAAVAAASASPPERVLALHTASHDGTLALRGARDAERKLILDDATGVRELYDLRADPREQRNLTGEQAAGLEQALAQLGAIAPSTAAPQPDAKTVEALQALGYLPQ